MTDDLAAIFAAWAAKASERPFLRFPNGAVQSYGAAWAAAGALAGRFVAEGLRPGDRLALQAEKAPEVVTAYLACLRAGLVFLPMNPSYTPQESAYLRGDAKPALTLLGEGLAPGPADLGRSAPLAAYVAEALAAEAPPPEGPPGGAERLQALLYTSGTTGRPKGAMLSAGNLAVNAKVLAGLWGFTADDVLLHALPLFHTHGLFVALNTVIVAGASALFLPGFTAESVLAALPQCSVMMGVPTYYTRLLERPALTPALCQGMRLFISGSAPLSPATHAAFAARTGQAILERYGMTETNMLTANPLAGPRRPGSVGPALPGTALRIVDPESGAPLPPGSVGSVEVKGASVFQGYWQAPEKTQAEFRADGYFITGDLGFLDAEGYLHLVGRAKDLIITGGLNVYPAEVEAALTALPGIADAAVIGVPHPDFGEAVLALVVPQEAGADLAAWRAALRTKLAPYKCPKDILLRESFPRNAMGKVQKNLLRAAYAGHFAAPEGAA